MPYRERPVGPLLAAVAGGGGALDGKDMVEIAALLAVSCQQRDSFWFKGNLESAAAVARERDSLLMLKFYTDWCNWCRRLDRETFSDRDVRRAVVRSCDWNTIIAGAAPRLATPRQKVPRGAVAIADRQTAVYPAVSPGGWNLIGLCPTRMFDPERDPSMPVKAGDRVRFEAIDRADFLDLGGEL